MLTCNVCSLTKHLEDFPRDKRRPNGYDGSRCTSCKFEGDKQRQLPLIKFIADYLKANPCVDCGEDDLLVLQFDHLRDKSFNISSIIGVKKKQVSLKILKEEIAKCQVLCGNCHLRKSAKEQNHWRLEYV